MLTYLPSSIVSEFSHSKCQKSLYITTPLRLNPPTEGLPWENLRKIFCGCQWIARVSYGEKQDQKAPRPIKLLNDSFGNRRFLKGCVTLNARNRSMDRRIGEWCSYNFAAGSFHTKKLCSRLFSREVEFYWHKQRYRVFVLPFGGLRGNVHGSSMAHWKARGRLPIGDNWTFFASYHGWGAMSRYWSKFRCLKGVGGLLWTKILGGKGRLPPTNFGIRKLESLGYRMVKKIAENFNRLSRAHQRHRQTTDGRPIAYSERERKYHVR